MAEFKTVLRGLRPEQIQHAAGQLLKMLGYVGPVEKARRMAGEQREESEKARYALHGQYYGAEKAERQPEINRYGDKRREYDADSREQITGGIAERQPEINRYGDKRREYDADSGEQIPGGVAEQSRGEAGKPGNAKSKSAEIINDAAAETPSENDMELMRDGQRKVYEEAEMENHPHKGAENVFKGTEDRLFEELYMMPEEFRKPLSESGGLEKHAVERAPVSGGNAADRALSPRELSDFFERDSRRYDREFLRY